MVRKERIHVTVEIELLEQFKRIAELQRWSFATASEVALELFVKEFGPLYGITLTPEPSLEMEKVQC